MSLPPVSPGPDAFPPTGPYPAASQPWGAAPQDPPSAYPGATAYYPGGGYGMPPGQRRPPDVQAESKAGARARTALIVGMVAYPIQWFSYAVTMSETGSQLNELFSTSSSRRTSTFGTPQSGAAVAASITQQLSSLVVLGVGVMVLIWVYKAAENAATIGYPAALSPIWAIFGWMVPIVNFWFPYQTVRDLLPPEHPDRPVVIKWWVLYIGQGLTVCGMLPFVFTGGGIVGPGIFALLGSVAIVAAGLLLRRIITTVSDDHVAAARHYFGYQG